MKKVSRYGVYVVKAAESRPAKVEPKFGGPPSIPTEQDRRLARALLAHRKGASADA